MVGVPSVGDPTRPQIVAEKSYPPVCGARAWGCVCRRRAYRVQSFFVLVVDSRCPSLTLSPFHLLLLFCLLAAGVSRMLSSTSSRRGGGPSPHLPQRWLPFSTGSMPPTWTPSCPQLCLYRGASGRGLIVLHPISPSVAVSADVGAERSPKPRGGRPLGPARLRSVTVLPLPRAGLGTATARDGREFIPPTFTLTRPFLALLVTNTGSALGGQLLSSSLLLRARRQAFQGGCP